MTVRQPRTAVDTNTAEPPREGGAASPDRYFLAIEPSERAPADPTEPASNTADAPLTSGIDSVVAPGGVVRVERKPNMRG
jgi:hypothetical protein